MVVYAANEIKLFAADTVNLTDNRYRVHKLLCSGVWINESLFAVDFNVEITHFRALPGDILTVIHYSIVAEYQRYAGDMIAFVFRPIIINL